MYAKRASGLEWHDREDPGDLRYVRRGTSESRFSSSNNTKLKMSEGSVALYLLSLHHSLWGSDGRTLESPVHPRQLR